MLLKVKEDDQLKIFGQYGGLGYGGQRDFIRQYVKKGKKKAKHTTVRESRRKYTYQYFLKIMMGEKGCARHSS